MFPFYGPKMKQKALVLAASVLAACAATCRANLRTEAACAAQRYLDLNGYLDSQVTDTTTIDLQMWDAINFAKDGVIDREKLLAARQGRFTNRLRGVLADGDRFLVAYKAGGGYACVEVSRDLRTVHLAEAPCRPPGNFLRLTEQSLDCSSHRDVSAAE